MTSIKTMSAVAILTAAIATPVLAQDAAVTGLGSRYGLTPQPGATFHHARAYNQAYHLWNVSDSEFRRNKANFGFSGRDRSRIGGEAPWLHPGG
jgi:hypothetical protein